MSTPEQRELIRVAAEKATPGPWMTGVMDRGHGHETYAVCTEDGMPVEATLANVTLQASARSLLDELKAAESERDELTMRARYAEAKLVNAEARIAELESRKPEEGRETVPREIAHALWCEGARLHVNLKASVTMSPENWHVEGVEQRLAAWDKAAERYFDFSQGRQPPAVAEAKESTQ